MTWPIGEHYDTRSFDYETRRLEECGIEFGVTKRLLADHLPSSGIVVDVGVGVGHYAAFVAERGFDVHLVDVSERLLEAAGDRLKQAGFTDRLLGSHHAAAQDLSLLPDGCADAVLMLGPLYHLPDREERDAAAAEAHRLLKPGGRIFAAGINRLAFFRDMFISHPERLLERASFHDEFLEHGEWHEDPDTPLLQAHMTTIAELRELFADRFREIALAGAESFVPWLEQKQLTELDESTREAWIDLAYRTCTWPEALGAADHLVFVGGKEP